MIHDLLLLSIGAFLALSFVLGLAAIDEVRAGRRDGGEWAE